MGLIIPYVGLSHSRYINSMDKSETTIVTDITDETATTDTTVTFVQPRFSETSLTATTYGQLV